MLYQFIIKVLMGNSDTIFTALVMGVFGYMGWLLWNINERLKDFKKEWEKYESNLDSLSSKVDRIDMGANKELLTKLDKNISELDKLLLVTNDNNNELEKARGDIISAVRDSANEVKDIIMILMNNRARSIKKEILDENNNNVKNDNLKND